MAHFREGKAQLQLAGAADPTGRGFGYSFVRDIRHKVGGCVRPIAGMSMQDEEIVICCSSCMLEQVLGKRLCNAGGSATLRSPHLHPPPCECSLPTPTT